MSDQFKAGFANIAARKLARDRDTEDAEAAKRRAEQEAAAQWTADKTTFQSHYRAITDIISDHTETLRAANLSLRTNAPSFDDQRRTGSITVYLVNNGVGGSNSISFSLRRGAIEPAMAQLSGSANQNPAALDKVDRSFYEAAILAMLEVIFPPDR